MTNILSLKKRDNSSVENINTKYYMISTKSLVLYMFSHLSFRKIQTPCLFIFIPTGNSAKLNDLSKFR